MYSWLRRIRRASQLLFFIAFVLLFAFAAFPLRSPIPVDLFLRADPLIALSATVSLRRIVFPLLWYALPVVVLSVLLGRVFCGWICPMGTAIDACERIFRIRGRRPAGAPQLRRLKFYLLAALVITMLLPAAHRSSEELGISETVGLSMAYLADPIALLTRTLTWVALPASQWAVMLGSDTLTGWSSTDFVLERDWLDRALAPLQLGFATYTRPNGAYFRLGMLSFAIFVTIVALGGIARRFWCRNLCPLGALLGVLGRASPVRLAVSDACTECLRCVHECKVGAIGENPRSYSGPECIGCCSCIDVCPENAISIVAGRAGSGRDDRLDLSRRRLMYAGGLGVAAVVLPKADWGARRSEGRLHKISSTRLIRPPGSLAEDKFVTACVRCGECMKVCPTNALHPAWGEGGLEALGTPILVPRIGPCQQACDLCGKVCPTRAIQPFTEAEKGHLYLGTASIDRSICIAWASQKICLVCDEACSYDAIYQVEGEGVSRPVVDERVCVGCGMCEWVCPVEPLGAIRVNSSGDRRHLAREEQRRHQTPEQDADYGSPYPGA